MSEEKKWVRYRHKSNRAIEYEVESTANGLPIERRYPVSGKEPCFYIRTVRNISLVEGRHQPAFTMMPADEFLEIYEEAGAKP